MTAWAALKERPSMVRSTAGQALAQPVAAASSRASRSSFARIRSASMFLVDGRRRSSGHRAAAARARARGAAEAVPAGLDRARLERREVEVADVTGHAGLDRKVEHLVEIAVVERPVPADRDRV